MEESSFLDSRIIPDAELQRSIHLLDEAMNSSGGNICSSKTNLNRSSILDNKRLSSLNLNKSVRQRNQRLNSLSLTMDPGELNALLNDTTTTSFFSKAQEKFKSVTSRLFLEFLEALQSHGSEQQVFETVADFIQTCSDMIEVLENLGARQQGIAWLINERNTWRLIYCLYQYRINLQVSEAEDDPMIISRQHPLSEKEIAAQLFKKDPDTYECQLIVDWLEKNAQDQQLEVTRPQHFVDKTVAWENTLHQLQNESAKIPFRSSRPIISSLDPDAPRRERKSLHDIDKEDDERLLKFVFEEIRCGRLDEAQKLCCYCGQPWRAASLEGWRLFHDPNYDNPETIQKLPIEGNPNRDLWKLCAWNLADDHMMSGFARATYAIYSGNISAILSVCETWSDILWAYLRTQVDIRVEHEIRSLSLKSYTAMPDSYWKNEKTMEDIFAEIASSKVENVRKESSDPDKIVQKYLILNQVAKLMDSVKLWLNIEKDIEGENLCDTQFLRFLAHLILFLRLIGQSKKEDIGNLVIEAYVKVLINQHDSQLVAFYTAMLPQSVQIALYSQFLEDITDLNERLNCLQSAEDAGLDVEAITKTVVQNIRNKESENPISNLQEDITPEDLEKICALEWVVFYPSQRSEALWQTNALIRYFVAAGKLEAARKAFNKIPGDSINLIVNPSQGLEERVTMLDETIPYVHNIPQRSAMAVREFLCWKAYLDAQEGFSDWFHHFHNAKPVAPVTPSENAPYTEKVNYDHLKKQYESELERWQLSINQQTKTVKSQLYNVLLFPEGGWLVDPVPDFSQGDVTMIEEEESGRCQQMKRLRELCIPKVVLLLHTVLHSIEEYEKCMELADLVTSDTHQLYKVYPKQKLGELLGKLCESSLQLMDKKKDPWGLPISS